jgi:hypothetical protein
MKQVTFLKMYMDIYNKYGKDSKELKRFKDIYGRYPNHYNTLYRVYLIIMKGE